MGMKRSDTLLFRNNIPHAGAENLTDNLNGRLYSFLTIDEWDLLLNKDFTTKGVYWEVVPGVKWDEVSFSFKIEYFKCIEMINI